MATALQASVLSSLTKRQVNSLTALQNKVENVRGYATTVRTSNAQMAAMQAAYTAAKASGLPIPPHVAETATRLGLK